ncbi:MAG: DUF554 domain-containing protein [Clostridiales bacterium]|nr:DUF554 domain-containing protein [Clostridiales bacterium]
MPVGVIAEVLSVVIGGIIGAAGGGLLSEDFKEKLNMIFGLCAMSMGISSIALMENMPAVVFAVIIGTVAGLAIHLGDRINAAGGWMVGLAGKFLKNGNSAISREEYMASLQTVIVLFCASGTGIYGSIVAGMNGDHSILIAKSILDFFTSLIFACNLGVIVSLIGIPQLVIFLALYALAGVIYPLTTPVMVNDFKACGGFLLLAIGFRMIRVKMFPTADMIPAMILVMPASWFWVDVVLPLL